MKNRYTVLGLSIVLALALAVPALGGPSNPIASISASAKSIANKALKKAKAAQKAADSAQNTANSASSAAASAQKDATGAQKGATDAQKEAATAAKAASTAQSTANAAKTAADAAKAAAVTAQATADGKMSGAQQVEGEKSGGLAIAVCPSGKIPTGGGFIVLGADNDAANVTQSTQYFNGWIVLTEQIEGTAGTSWETVATVNCATSP